MEVWLSPALGFNYDGHTAQIPGDGSKPISYVSYKDVAEFAAASVDNPDAENEVLEIGGPEALTPAQVVKEFENISGPSFYHQLYTSFRIGATVERSNRSHAKSFCRSYALLCKWRCN
jgi:Predicted nucleoside-diphosphate-sugar epimerases